MRTALRSHPSILAAEQLERAAGQGVTIARAGFLPTVDLRYANGWARTNSTSTRTRASRGDGDSQSVTLFRIESSLTVSQMLFDGFATVNRTDAARARVTGAGFQVVGIADGIALRAAAGYMNVLQARRLVGIAEAYVAAHNDVIEGLEALVAEGAATEAELEQAQGRLAAADGALTQFRGTLRDAEAAFREAVGDWPGDAVMPLIEPTGLPAEAEDAVAEATTSHPSLLAAAENVRSLQLDLRAAGAVFLPRVSLDLVGSRGENAGGVEAPGGDFTAMLTMTYNFYRGGADRAAVETSKALLSEARLRQEETRRLIEQNAWVATNAYEVANARLPQLQDAAGAAATAQEDWVNQFDLGEATLPDRLGVEDQVFAAETALVSGEIAVVLAHYQILAAMGRLRNAF